LDNLFQAKKIENVRYSILPMNGNALGNPDERKSPMHVN